jgi:hypothetical protein
MLKKKLIKIIVGAKVHFRVHLNHPKIKIYSIVKYYSTEDVHRNRRLNNLN